MASGSKIAFLMVFSFKIQGPSGRDSGGQEGRNQGAYRRLAGRKILLYPLSGKGL